MDIGKYAVVLAVAVALAASCGLAWAGQKTTTFSVRGLSCARDEVSVTDKLKGLEGIMERSADSMGGEVVATFDDEKTTVEAIKKAIEEVGYGVEKVQVK